MASASSLGNVQILPNLTAFRGLSAAGMAPVVFLQGTTTPLDGGQGFYAVNLTDKTTADNGTSVVVDGGGYRWELISADTATQIIAALSFNGTLPALDPILGGSTSIAAATTTNLATVTQAAVAVTGSGVSISAFGTLGAGRIRVLTFADVNTLVYNATSMILPGGANIVTAANDVAGFISLGGGNWQCIWYTEASGGTPGTLPISEGGTGKTTSVTAFDALAAAGANIASASTTNLATATGPVVNVTGSVTITAFGTATAGVLRFVRFTAAPLLTYNASSLILPTAANIQAAAGDAALFKSLGSGNWTCLFYQRASGLQLGVNTIPLGGTGQITSVAAFNALQAKGADITAASTTDLSAAAGPFVNVTGNTTITAFGTVAAGVQVLLRFTDTPLLTYNVTSLILPGAANIQVVAGDTALFESLGSGNWRCISFFKNSWTGAGSFVLSTSPTLVTPALGTPDSGVLTNCTNFLGANAGVGVVRVLFTLIGANMDSTADQPFTKIGTFTNWKTTQSAAFCNVVNATANLTTAAGGIYSGAAKGGDALVANTQTYVQLTTAAAGMVTSGTALGQGIRSGTPILSLTTGQGGAALADFYIIGVALS